MPLKNDPCALYGFTARSKKRRKDETPEKFLKRVVKTAPKVIAGCKGDLPTVALVFDVPIGLMEDLVRAHTTTLGKAVRAARALEHAKAEENKQLAKEARETLRGAVGEDKTDRRLKRKAWSTDPDQRASDICDALLVSLVENEGNLAEVGKCLNVPVHEILELMEGNEELLSARDAGLRVKAAMAESRLFDLAAQGNVQSVKMVLTNLNGDMWSERQQVDVRRVGFAPPDEKDEEASSILSLIKGEKKNA